MTMDGTWEVGERHTGWILVATHLDLNVCLGLGGFVLYLTTSYGKQTQQATTKPPCIHVAVATN